MSEPNPDRGLVVHAGPITVDIPRSLGYYGGIAIAVGVGVIEPPLGLFIGAIPVVKMLMHGQAPQPLRFLGQVFDGAAQPVGGDAEGTIRVANGSDGSDSGDDSGQRTRAGNGSAASSGNRTRSARRSSGTPPAETGGGSVTPAGSTVPAGTRTDPEQQAAVRAWAAEHGHQLSSRGRIPSSIWDAYEAAAAQA